MAALVSPKSSLLPPVPGPQLHHALTHTHVQRRDRRSKARFLQRSKSLEMSSLLSLKMRSHDTIRAFLGRGAWNSIGEKIIEAVGEDLQRPGLQDTPKRASEAFKFLTHGYHQDLKTVTNDALFPSDSSEMVLVQDIELARCASTTYSPSLVVATSPTCHRARYWVSQSGSDCRHVC